MILRPMLKEDEEELLAFFTDLSVTDGLYLRDDVTNDVSTLWEKWVKFSESVSGSWNMEG